MNDKFDRMMRIRDLGGLTEEKVIQLKKKYNSTKRKGARKQPLDQIKG